MRVEHIGDAVLYLGHVTDALRLLPAESVQTVVTSPPYWGLRDYGVDGQIGLEDTPEEYVEKMVDVFREVRRVLRDDGTVWLNLGDTYNSRLDGSHGGWNGDSYDGGNNPQRVMNSGADVKPMTPGLKPKNLVGIPWRVAFALQADGWYLRQDIIWSKPNPMPESVTDRCTKAHEYIFLLSKSARYFYDAEAIKESVSESTHARMSQNLQAQEGSHRANGGAKTNGPMRAVVAGSTAKIAAEGSGIKNNVSFQSAIGMPVSSRNKRSVWTVPTAPYSAAHFATFPPKLIEPCILAGSRQGDTVLDPFGGSGTTAGVALKHGRKAILCELSEEYATLVPERIRSITDAVDQPRLFEDEPVRPEQLPLDMS